MLGRAAVNPYLIVDFALYPMHAVVLLIGLLGLLATLLLWSR